MFGIADGYTTYINGIISVLVGIYLIANGNIETGTGFIIGGMGLMGIRNGMKKIE